MYLTYEEYIQMETGAPMDESAFQLAEFKARKTIDYWTDCRVQSMASVPEAVKFCIVAIIKLQAKYGAEAQVDNPVLSGYNTDGYSESYGSATEQAAGAQKATRQAVEQWLYGELDDEGTPLLYRGLT